MAFQLAAHCCCPAVIFELSQCRRRVIESGRRQLRLLVAILGVAAAPAFAALVHPVCAAKQHDCGTSTKIVSCCCGDQSDASRPTAPAPSTVQLIRIPMAVSGLPGVVSDTTPSGTFFRAQTAPRAGPVDLSTLFSCLLI